MEMKIILVGYGGHMGAHMREAIREASDCSLVCGIDPFYDGTDANVFCAFKDAMNVEADVIIDFSNHHLTNDLVAFAVAKRLPLVIATTGQTDDERKAIADAGAQIPVFYSANYSIGVAALIAMAKFAVRTMPDASLAICETHHTRKLDAPSGTALAIAEAMHREMQDEQLPEREIPIRSIREGDVVGIHEVVIHTPSQTLTLKHEAHSRRLFADGALPAARFLVQQKPGCYGMTDLIRF